MKNLVSLFFAIVFVFMFVCDCYAQGDADSQPKLRDKIEPVQLKKKDSSDKSKTENSSKPANVDVVNKKSRSNSGSDVSLPVRLASTTTGLILGYPVAVARCLYRETKDGTRDFVGDSTNPVFVVPAALLSFPFAVFGSPFEGFGYSALNSWRASGEEPFGRDTFSLGDWE